MGKRLFAWIVVGLLATTASSAWAGPSADGLGLVIFGGLALWLLGAVWAALLAHWMGRSKALWAVVALGSPFVALWGYRLVLRGYDPLGDRTLWEEFGIYVMIASATSQFWLPTLGLLATSLIPKRASA